MNSSPIHNFAQLIESSRTGASVFLRRALLSVSDKTGVVELARSLAGVGCELIATGGTRAHLLEAGFAVTDVSSLTGDPEAFGGRMKTISFAVESALLFHRERDAQEAMSLGIKPIDLVVCNLYPFGKHADLRADLFTLVENIDIGGPTMIRAAAKNFQFVTVLTDCADYGALIAELGDIGSVCLETRIRLMRKAFRHTADYDAVVSEAFEARAGNRTVRLAFESGIPLRYGENSHQEAWFLRQVGAHASLYDMQVFGGKEISYNNIVDISCAAETVRDLPLPSCAVIKHGNPCGLASASSAARALELAWEGDVVSAFGSIVAFNRPIDVGDLAYLQLDYRERKFVEVVVAPDFTQAAEDLLKRSKNLRIVKWDPALMTWPQEMKWVGGALLLQTSDQHLREKIRLVVGSSSLLSPDLVGFGQVAVRQIRSNAIVIVRRTQCGAMQLIGMGAGQPNRAVSVQLAVHKARENLLRETDESGVARILQESVLFSDAFFPFPDGIEACAEAGLRVVVQPGGSVRDDAVIERARDLGLAMAFTGVRHFKH